MGACFAKNHVSIKRNTHTTTFGTNEGRFLFSLSVSKFRLRNENLVSST